MIKESRTAKKREIFYCNTQNDMRKYKVNESD